jgi:uncharacterized membrane protein
VPRIARFRVAFWYVPRAHNLLESHVEAIWLFHRGGLFGASRMLHVIVGVMWMGLLWFFNFVQTPAYAEMEAGARNNAFDKLTWRALWWFRWAAAATVASGILILLFGGFGDTDVYGSTWWKSPSGLTLAIGILFGLTMFLNVWLVIWPNQQKVIANARNVQAGGEADPAAPSAARKGALASRQNTIFSLPLLVFMVGATHFWGVGDFNQAPGGGARAVWFLLSLVIWAALELNALGIIGGFGTGGTNVIYDTHQNAIWTGVALIAIFYILTEILF